MKDNEVLKLFIPLVAVVVIFESVLLVSNLTKKNQTTTKAVTVNVNEAGNSAKVQEANTPVAFDLVFGTKTKDMKVGQSYTVEVDMVGKDNYALDGVDLYVKFDQTAFTVSNLNFDNILLPKPTYSKISTKGLIVANYLVMTQGGLKVNKGVSAPIMKFNIVPKKSGNFSFEIATGNQDKQSVTMFVESSTSKVLPFSSNSLNVNVLK